MFRNHSIRWAALVAASIFGTAGCQSTVTESMSQQPPAAPAPERIAAQPKPQTPVDALPTVYFELDRWQLREDARMALQASARQIQAQPDQAVVTIEGHCDDRGSDEYNMALGKRRAGAVKRYLVDLGVSASRFETVTYGESRPAVRGEGEQAWRKNRRSELRIGFRQAAR
jgi:peptidoglycan-associated lipoprotein